MSLSGMSADSDIEKFDKLLTEVIDRFFDLGKATGADESMGGGSPFESSYELAEDLLVMYKKARSATEH